MGGPIFNQQGQVVGINGLTVKDNIIHIIPSLVYGIPINTYKRLAKTSNGRGYRRPYTNIPLKNSAIHKGYCTFFAISKSKNIVNNPCLIHDYQNGNYKLTWSNSKESNIMTNPHVLVNNAPASIIAKGANNMTVKWTQGRIGFCWNCNLPK